MLLTSPDEVRQHGVATLLDLERVLASDEGVAEDQGAFVMVPASTATHDDLSRTLVAR